MNEKIDLKEIEQKTFGEFMIDGITEILAGILLLIVPFIYVYPFLMVFIVFFVFFGGQPIINTIRNKTTYPRIGRVEFKTEDETFSVKKSLLEFVMLILGAIILTFITMFLFEGEITNLELWYKWVPLLFGLIMFGPSLYLVEKTGKKYNYILGIVCTTFGLLYSIIDLPNEKDNMFLYFFTLGLLSLIIGIFRFIAFISRYPVIDIEGE